MNTANTFIGDARRAAEARQTTMIGICATGVIMVCLILAGNVDLDEADAKAQRTADVACRAAGAQRAVKVELLDRDGYVFICNKPVARRDA